VILLLAALALAPQGALRPLEAGESFAYARTFRYLNEEEKVDVSESERVTYTSIPADAREVRFSVLLDLQASPWRDPGMLPERVVRLRSTGGILGDAVESEPMRGRVERMIWTTTERRSGLRWSRRWAAGGGLPLATVTVRPAPSGKAGSLSVTYEEEGGVKGEAVVDMIADRPMPAEIAATFTGVRVEKLESPVKVAVSQRLVVE
jgi:hypothetical protein